MTSNGDVGDGVTLRQKAKVMELNVLEISVNCYCELFQPEKLKPSRPCPFCDLQIAGGKLKRHVLRRHQDLEEVHRVKMLSPKQQKKAATHWRAEGIYRANLRKLASAQEDVQHLQDFLASKNFCKHRKLCSDSADPLKTSILTERGTSTKFSADILSKFRDGEVGTVCRNDPLIRQVGYRHYSLRAADKGKSMENKKNIMGEMRILGNLFLRFKQHSAGCSSAEDMFKRENIGAFRLGIEDLCEQKYGLKLNVHAVIQRTIKVLKGIYVEEKKDDSAKEVELFQTAYAFRAHEIYADARHKTIANSLEKSRRPEALPNNSDLEKLNIYITDLLKSCKDVEGNFCIIRSALVCRLTLFNARRGEEGSRLLLKQFEDSLAGVWIPSEVENIRDEAEHYLLGKYKLAYLTGKGRKFVPILIPNDIIPTMKLLAAARAAYGIPASNPFLFGCKHSDNHCSGWQAVSTMCHLSGVKPITATAMRHKVSTLYASLEMTPSERETFLKHMGHAQAINEDNYQCPAGIREVRVMGPLLSKVAGELFLLPCEHQLTKQFQAPNPVQRLFQMTKNPLQKR